MRKSLILFIVAAGVTLSTMQIAAAESVTQTVTLKQTTPAYVLQRLGVTGQPRSTDISPLLSGAWKTLSRKNNIALPKGVESVTAGEQANSLVIKGEKTAVDQMIALLEPLDSAKPAMVQVQAEFYELTPELSSEQDVPYQAAAGHPIITVDILEQRRTQLTSRGAKLVTTVIIKTYTGCPAQAGLALPVIVSDDPKVKQDLIGFSVIPLLNTDNTVTVNAMLTVSYMGIVTRNSDKGYVTEDTLAARDALTQRRVSLGDAIPFRYVAGADAKPYLVLIISKVAD